MIIEIKVPTLPESVTDATVAKWYKGPGDRVERDENLVDLETDKVMLEVPSPKSGVLQEIRSAEGEIVSAEQVLALINEAAVTQEVVSSSSTDSAETSSVTSAAAGPSARRAAEEQQVELSHIQGTGKQGRVTKQDVMSHQEVASSSVADARSAEVQPVVGSRTEQRVPMSRLRARIAERLVQVQQSAAILTTFNEVNMQPVKSIRAQYKEQFEKVHGVRLGFMSFFTKAVVEALKRFPAVNASIDGTDVIYHNFFDVGIAVSTERGLVVPVLRNVESMSIADIEKGIREYAEKARTGKLSIEEMTGGTFTITNGGVFGSMMATPIINPPQSAILGMHNIVDRPVVEEGEIVVRPIMYIALSYDHRIIDGKESVSYLRTVKELLEDPSRILLQV